MNTTTNKHKIGTAILLIKEGTTLIYLSQRLGSYQTGKFCCPGGMVEDGEQYESAILRELKEETDLNPTDLLNLKYCGMIEHIGGKSDYTIWYKASTNAIPKNTEPLKHTPWLAYHTNELNQEQCMLSTTEAINLYHLI